MSCSAVLSDMVSKVYVGDREPETDRSICSVVFSNGKVVSRLLPEQDIANLIRGVEKVEDISKEKIWSGVPQGVPFDKEAANALLNRIFESGTSEVTPSLIDGVWVGHFCHPAQVCRHEFKVFLKDGRKCSGEVGSEACVRAPDIASVIEKLSPSQVECRCGTEHIMSQQGERKEPCETLSSLFNWVSHLMVKAFCVHEPSGGVLQQCSVFLLDGRRQKAALTYEQICHFRSLLVGDQLVGCTRIVPRAFEGKEAVVNGVLREMFIGRDQR